MVPPPETPMQKVTSLEEVATLLSLSLLLASHDFYLPHAVARFVTLFYFVVSPPPALLLPFFLLGLQKVEAAEKCLFFFSFRAREMLVKKGQFAPSSSAKNVPEIIILGELLQKEVVQRCLFHPDVVVRNKNCKKFSEFHV